MTTQQASRKSATNSQAATDNVTREQLIDLLNEDLEREYQAVIGYVVYSQVLKGPEYMTIAKELEKHASEELSHALIISKQVDYQGGEPATKPKEVRTSDITKEMRQVEPENEAETDRAQHPTRHKCEDGGE